MKTMTELRDLLTADRAAYRALAQSVRANLARIEAIYSEDVAAGKTPKETVVRMIKEVGKEETRDILATLIMGSAWDGRISETAKEWAVNSGNVYDEEAAEALWIRSNIHCAHLSQLAEAAGSILPSDLEEPAPETEPDEETEPTVEDALETLDRAQAALDTRKDRSAWDKGVTVYASELLEGLREAVEGGYFSPDDLAAPKLLRKALLNGASDWSEYSWGGSSLIYDGDIARRLCSPSELRKTREGERRPNAREEWLDCQARALFQAANRVERTIREAL